MAIESPTYNVESKDGNIEIRKYDDYIVAQLDLEADYSSALNKGFPYWQVIYLEVITRNLKFL
jgi:hypothetical protein